MAAPSGRREARERALELLYEAEAKGLHPRDVVDALPLPPDAYAVVLATGVAEHRDDLDGLITRHSRNWRLDRMPSIDRTLLRLAAFELGHRSDVPTAVVIDEAVSLAKEYSTDDSGRFVNGVLAGIAREVRGTEEAGAPSAP